MKNKNQMLKKLFAENFSQELEGAGPEERERILKQRIAVCLNALPPVCRNLFDEQCATEEEIRIANELCMFKMPLMDGTAIDMGLPYSWTFGVDDDNLGAKAPRFIVPRIAFSLTLVRALQRTGDDKYAKALHAYIMDYVSRYWVDSTELPPKENWLCTACRCGTWHCTRFGGIYAALTCPEVSAQFSFDDLLSVFRAIDNMMTGLIPNLALGSNWRVHQITNVFTQGYVWAFMKHATFWRDLAVHALNEEFDVQFNSDGSHEERCTHYGAGTWQVFAAYAALARQAPELGIDFDPHKVSRCMDYVLSSCLPSGMFSALGDDYASRTPEQLDGVSPAFPKEKTTDWQGIRPAAEWLADMGIPAAEFVLGRGQAPAWTSRRHRNSGYLFLRDGWSSHSLYADFNVGHYSSCHDHFDLLSIQLAGYGREFVVDPGCSALDPREINANMARTRGHSTISVDGLDQQVTVPARLSRCFLGNSYDLAVGIYKGGYCSGNRYGPGALEAHCFAQSFWGVHFRHLFFVKGNYWVVFDALSTQPGHTAETRFQFLPNAMKTLPAGGGYTTGWSESNCALLPLHWTAWNHAIHTGENDPVEGWMPYKNGELIPAPVYKATAQTDTGPLWHGSLIFPYKEADLPRIDIQPLDTGGTGFAYRISTDAWTDILFLSNSWASRQVNLEQIATNAPLVHARFVNGQLAGGCTCEGTFLTIAGKTVFNAPGTMLAREFDAKGNVTATMQPRK